MCSSSMSIGYLRANLCSSQRSNYRSPPASSSSAGSRWLARGNTPHAERRQRDARGGTPDVRRRRHALSSEGEIARDRPDETGRGGAGAKPPLAQAKAGHRCGAAERGNELRAKREEKQGRTGARRAERATGRRAGGRGESTRATTPLPRPERTREGEGEGGSPPQPEGREEKAERSGAAPPGGARCHRAEPAHCRPGGARSTSGDAPEERCEQHGGSAYSLSSSRAAVDCGAFRLRCVSTAARERAKRAKRFERRVATRAGFRFW